MKQKHYAISLLIHNLEEQSEYCFCTLCFKNYFFFYKLLSTFFLIYVSSSAAFIIKGYIRLPIEVLTNAHSLNSI
jgi:hypothetical protein